MTRALQQMIHVGCRQLGLEPEDRHDLQLLACGKASMKDMTAADLEAVLKALKQRGFKAEASPKPRKSKSGSSHREAAPRADLRLIHVLWGKLGRAGKLKVPGREGLNAFIRARYGKAWGAVPADIDMLRDWRQIATVLDALKDWCMREGIALEDRP